MSLYWYIVGILCAGTRYEVREVLHQKQHQNESVLDSLHDSLRSSFEPEMVYVEGGTFSMGSNDGESDEQPVHTVQLDGYYIGKYEVTQAQWMAVMGTNPSSNQCDLCPVENVSWREVHAFIVKINQMTGKSYRLPTEAEWEYAARGGKKSLGYVYAGSNDLERLDRFLFNGGTNTHVGGGHLNNELGIYDMSGNVSEWCSDRFVEYPDDDLKNPKGPSLGDSYIIRGGRWSYSESLCRNTNRSSGHPDNKSSGLGFRLACSEEQRH